MLRPRESGVTWRGVFLTGRLTVGAGRFPRMVAPVEWTTKGGEVMEKVAQRPHGTGQSIAEQHHDDHKHNHQFHPAGNPGEKRASCKFEQQI